MKFVCREYGYCTVIRELEVTDELIEDINRELDSVATEAGHTFKPLSKDEIIQFFDMQDGERYYEDLDTGKYITPLGEEVIGMVCDYVDDDAVTKEIIPEDTIDWEYSVEE